MNRLRNGRRWALALILVAVCAPVAAAMYHLGFQIVSVVYFATKLQLKGGSRDVPIAPYASSRVFLSTIGTSQAAMDQIRSRVDRNADAILLASAGNATNRGSLYLQLSYFLAPRTVVTVECGDTPGLVSGTAGEQRLGGVVYYAMDPPAWVRKSHPPALLTDEPSKRVFFVPFPAPVKEISNWTQFCR